MPKVTETRPNHRAETFWMAASLCAIGCGGDGSIEVGGSATGSSSSSVNASSDNEGSVGTASSGEPPGPTAVVVGDCETVVQDPALALYLWGELGLAPGSLISSEALAALEWIDAEGLGITTLAGLECAVGLESISVKRSKSGQTNAVSDLTPLANLPRLERLYLSDNPLSELTPLGILPALYFLDIAHTETVDLTPLANHPALEMLYAAGTPVTNVEPLVASAGLRSIEVDETLVSDVTPLAALQELDRLKVSGTSVSNLTVFAGTDVELLWADEVQVSTLPEGMPLRVAHFARNEIHDISPLLTWDEPSLIDLSNNEIDDLSPLLEIPWELGPGGCLEIDLRGNPLSHPDTASVMQQVCDEYVVSLRVDDGRGCSHVECVGPPP